jgi:catalase
MLGHLALVEEALANAVESAIGMEGKRAEITPYQTPIDLDPSPALSLVGKAKPILKGRKCPPSAPLGQFEGFQLGRISGSS